MSNHSKQMQRLVTQYRAAGEPWPAASRDMAEWAIARGLWKLDRAALAAAAREAAVRSCAEDLSRAMREEYMTDRRGRRVRVKHPVTTRRGTEQYVIWDDIRTAPRAHMEVAFQQRRVQIVGDCRQLKADVDSYNESRPAEPPIQLIFDFTRDLEELEGDAAA